MPHFPKTWAALAVSTLAHGALAGVVAGHGLTAGKTPALTVAPVELLVTEAPDPVEIQEDEHRVEATRSIARANSPAPHHHSYRVATNHDATPHDPKLVHAPVQGAETPPETPDTVTSPEAPPVFVLGPSAALVAHGTPGMGTSTGTPSGSEILGERDVSVRARLLARGTLNYPAEARHAGVEADVPVGIVVDETGRVVSARALERPGYGLDVAAVESVRAYRFAPARRDGQAVRVRMRWVVQFHLD